MWPLRHILATGLPKWLFLLIGDPFCGQSGDDSALLGFPVHFSKVGDTVIVVDDGDTVIVVDDDDDILQDLIYQNLGN